MARMRRCAGRGNGAASTLDHLQPAHMHMNLLGFITMMIFGLGYQVVIDCSRVIGKILANSEGHV